MYLYHEKRALRDFIEADENVKWTVQEDSKREYCHIKDLREKFFVPDSSYTVESRVKWLEGYLDADGTLLDFTKSQSIQVACVEIEFLKEVQLMLQTLGVDAKLCHARDEGRYLLPKNDGSEELAEYDCKEVQRLLINGEGVYSLFLLGFSPKRLLLKGKKPQRDCKHFNKILSVVDEGRISDTFCFTEPKRNMGMFNGVLTGQCSEVILHSDADHTYTCVLSSMNVAKWDEWKDTDAVYTATVFLDCVAEEFIEIGKNIRGLEKAVRYTEKHRALGLGVLGLHTLFQSKMLPFDGFEAHMLNSEIFEHIDKESLKASKWMAEQWGEPEVCVGYGVRNTHRTAVAPTTSSALICGSVSQGIEPLYQNAYVQGSSAGEMNRVNPDLIPLMEEAGVYDDKTIEDIIDKQGSVQHVDWLTEEQKAVFKTAFELDQSAILRLASQRQKFICQAQSLNLFFSADEDEGYIASIHRDAFLDPYIKSLYYMRTLSGVQAAKNECVACEG